MKNKKQSQPVERLFIQLWRNPIFYGELLADITPEQWHTFTGLTVFMNSDGECNPSSSKLKQILGLSSRDSVSARIKSLEAARFNGEPLIVVTRRRKKDAKGKLVFANNQYKLNQQIATIFSVIAPISMSGIPYTERIKEMKAKLASSLDVNRARKETNITRNSF